MPTDDDHIDDTVEELLHEEEKHRRTLAMLLNKYASGEDSLLVERTYMGGTEAYLGAVTLDWFAEKVRFASSLTLFSRKLDEQTGSLIIDDETIDDIQQRPLDWSRQASLAQYLATKKVHKFPPVLVVGTRPWVDDPQTDEWVNEKAQVSSITFTPLDQQGNLGLIDVSSDMFIYALDGQHRLMGVLGLMDLIRQGRLPRKAKDGKEKGSAPITTDYLEKEYGVTPEYLQQLGKERIGIEFVTGVAAGETREDAKQRVRSIFVHVNTMAAPLSKSQTDQLDEDYGFAIIARRAAVEHRLLKGKVEWNKTNVTEKATQFTTLHTLKEMSHNLLGTRFKRWRKDAKDLVPQRPDDKQLEQGYELFKQFLDQFMELPSIRRVCEGASCAKERGLDGECEANVLYRPVAQMALAEAAGRLIYAKQMGADGVFEKIKKFDEEGGFRGINQKTSPWYGVLYDVSNRRIRLPGRPLAEDLMAYLFGGGIQDDVVRKKLRDEFAVARTVEEGKATDLGGGTVHPNQIHLPPAVH